MNSTMVPAMPGDAPLLLEMMQEYYRHDGLEFVAERARTALLELLRNSQHGRAWLVVLPGNEVAGYIVLTFGYSLEYHGRDAFVDELYLRAPYRRRGVGGAALAFAVQYCARHGIRALYLAVERGNAAARAFYATQGFATRGQSLYYVLPELPG